MIFEQLNKEVCDWNDDKYYSFNEIKEKYSSVTELIEECVWIAIKYSDDKESSLIEFGLFGFSGSNFDGSNLKVSCIFEGYGFGGEGHSLRECRHTYWYPDDNGYGFYMNASHIKAGLDYLSKYFDLNS